MISFARSNTDCGIVRPSVLALLRLMTSSSTPEQPHVSWMPNEPDRPTPLVTPLPTGNPCPVRLSSGNVDGCRIRSIQKVSGTVWHSWLRARATTEIARRPRVHPWRYISSWLLNASAAGGNVWSLAQGDLPNRAPQTRHSGFTADRLACFDQKPITQADGDGKLPISPKSQYHRGREERQRRSAPPGRIGSSNGQLVHDRSFKPPWRWLCETGPS